jgi:hypothetical protein
MNIILNIVYPFLNKYLKSIIIFDVDSRHSQLVNKILVKTFPENQKIEFVKIDIDNNKKKYLYENENMNIIKETMNNQNISHDDKIKQIQIKILNLKQQL